MPTENRVRFEGLAVAKANGARATRELGACLIDNEAPTRNVMRASLWVIQ